MQSQFRFLLVLSLLFHVVGVLAQEPINIQHACAYDGEEGEKEYYEFNSSDEADRIIDKICNAVGIVKNFTVKSSNIKNALATVVGKQRYILYSTTFLEKFKADTLTTWAAYAVMAHEVGHHLNADDFSEQDMSKRKRMELNADLFSGSVLRVLGADLMQAQAGIKLFVLEGESTTHPVASARREAIANGWKKSDERFRESSSTSSHPADFDSIARMALLSMYNEITDFERYTKDIFYFLPRAKRIFEEEGDGETDYEYQEKMQNYLAVVRNIEATKEGRTTAFDKTYKGNSAAIGALDDWYSIALHEIHESLLLKLSDLVELGQSDPERRDIDGSITESEQARRDFQHNWSPNGVLYISLRGSITKLEVARKKLVPYTKL